MRAEALSSLVDIGSAIPDILIAVVDPAIRAWAEAWCRKLKLRHVIIPTISELERIAESPNYGGPIVFAADSLMLEAAWHLRRKLLVGQVLAFANASPSEMMWAYRLGADVLIPPFSDDPL